jgi:hypothetical protein
MMAPMINTMTTVMQPHPLLSSKACEMAVRASAIRNIARQAISIPPAIWSMTFLKCDYPTGTKELNTTKVRSTEEGGQ